MLLDSSTKSIELTLDAGVFSVGLPWSVSYVDKAQYGAIQAMHSGDGALTTTAYASVVPGPVTPPTGIPSNATPYARTVQFLTVYGADTIPAIVSVVLNDGGTRRVLYKASLAVGDQLCYIDGQGFKVVNAIGSERDLSVRRYTILLDYDANNNPVYLGMANPGSAQGDPVWLIRQFTVDGANNITGTKFANGSETFTAIWTNRAALPYS